MAAGPTYTPIATTTFSGGTTYTFSSIPSTYTDLVLVVACSSAAVETILLRFNGDTGTNYSWTRILGNGSSASSLLQSNTSGAVGGFMDNGQHVNITNIMNYSNTTTYKTTISRMNAPSSYVGAFTSMWRSTSAINSITILGDSGGTFNNGKATLYGIASA